MSRIYSPYRVLGLYSSDIPFVLKYVPSSGAHYAVVPVGERFNVYKLPKLTLVGSSDSVETPIKSLASCGDVLVASSGKTIYIFRNSRYLLRRLQLHTNDITHLCSLQNLLLASVDEGGLTNVWNSKSWEIVSHIEFSTKSFRVTSVLCPLNYKNKILFGSFQGPLQLWNVMSRRLLYWFKGFNSSVTCLQQAPAVDVCAIGLADGRVIIHNLRYDVTLMNFAQDGGAITSIGFKGGSHSLQNTSNVDEKSSATFLSDENDGVYLITGCETGFINCWQLQEGGRSRSVGEARNLHLGSVITIYCIPGEDTANSIVTSGTDNCIKVSYFDRPDGGPRTVYRRIGHSRPPNRILFWPGSSVGGALLLSAGKDGVLRIFSTLNEYMDKSFGCAYAPGVPDRRKATREQRSSWLLPEVVHMAACPARAEAWDSVVTIHKGKRQVASWNFMKATRGQHWFDPLKFRGCGGEANRLYKKTFATCVYMTNCGNYVLIGYSSGDVFKFNMQSGLERGSYGSPNAHCCSVVGVSVNNVNRVTITVGESEIRFWSFHEHKLLGQLDLPSTSLLIRFHADSDILAIALSNALIILVDVVHRQVIRTFINSELQVCVDMDISYDGRLLVSAHRGDPLIKTWDIVDSKLIDCFRVELPITSIALSKGSEFLSTTHANCLGIYLWDNCATYKRLHLQPLPVDFIPPENQSPVSLPTKMLMARNTSDATEFGLSTDTDEYIDNAHDLLSEDSIQQVYASPEQLHGNLLTLSGIPSSYFATLLNLDLINERNRLAWKLSNNNTNTQSVKTSSKNLPFFLPVIETNQGLVWANNNDDPDDDLSAKQQRMNMKVNCKRHRLLNKDFVNAIEPIQGLFMKLTRAKSDNDFDQISHVLKSVGPNAIDLEIRLLIPSVEVETTCFNYYQTIELHDHLSSLYDKLHGFLRFIINRFQLNRDFDLACICLEMLLRRYNDIFFKGRHNQCNMFHVNSKPGELIYEFLQGKKDDQVELERRSSYSITLYLIHHAIKAKEKSQIDLTKCVTQSLCLVDFIRNPVTALHL
ncbi:WD repeat-containing protein 36 [Schistosoma japonicum]|nr:WD repeat-containing protein 36 [Schistosoma japonicum]KAH8874329.1 WD repeat-containing protein 36 [Schistosoma japonicum]KAH8874330.1 WD repeat-containing protein 36 [Schistosoma japonicum]KAH8874332.1 WD repeat-containing protein 36 [Schistosoma japonicum]KAH8874333.1 WD repeat-containing protein 36 [Schistosoma japonicum]